MPGRCPAHEALRALTARVPEHAGYRADLTQVAAALGVLPAAP